jgi:hypothetical protein
MTTEESAVQPARHVWLARLLFGNSERRFVERRYCGADGLARVRTRVDERDLDEKFCLFQGGLDRRRADRCGAVRRVQLE